jgi:small-conductance mechanosensitive channel
MTFWLPSVALVAFLFVIFVIRRQGLFRPSSRVISSGVLAFLMWQALVYLRSGYTLVDAAAPTNQKILVILLLIFATNTVVLLLKQALFEILVQRYSINFQTFLFDLMSWVLIIVISLGGAGYLFDFDLTGFLVTSTVVSAIIGLSLQEVLSNLFVGIILQFETPFTVGDWVEVGGQTGRVVAQGWRTTSILTNDNHYVIFTNLTVANERIINYSRPDPVQRHEMFVGIDDNYPPLQVKKVVLEALLNSPNVVQNPPPVVQVNEFGDSEMIYKVRFWIDDYGQRDPIADEVHTRVWYALRRSNIPHSTPERNMNITMMPPFAESKQAAQRENFNVLQAMPFASQLNQTQLQRLFDISEEKIYTDGEFLVRQGDQGDSLFMIKSGVVGIFIKTDTNPHLRVDERVSGEFFGEMSLLTGDPRTASCVAEGDVQVLTISKDAFADVLTSDPVILRLFLDALDQHQLNMAKKRAQNEAELKETLAANRSALLGRITKFLGLSSTN